MKNCYKKMLLLLVSLSAMSPFAQAQRSVPSIENLPAVVVDTVETGDPDTKLILYSNNTWRYYRPELEARFDSLDVYKDYWVTSGMFAYKTVESSDIPEVIELNLVQDISEYHAPIKGRVYSKYSWRRNRMHKGVDIPLKTGDPIYATFDGRVRIAEYNSSGYGYFIILRHTNGLETWHGHLSRLNVEPGQYVKAGQVIGYGGSTGRSTGPHLHYEIRYFDQTFDPEYLIDFETGDLRYMTFSLEKSFLNSQSRASELLGEDDVFDMPETAGRDSVSEEILAQIDGVKNVSAADQRAVYHVIKSGDMLGKLAIRYGVSIDQICRLNNITRTTTLRLGRQLRIK